MLLLGTFSHPFIEPIYMLLMAISAAFGCAGEQGALPIIMGLLIDAGVSLSLQVLACCVYSIGASLVAVAVRKPTEASP